MQAGDDVEPGILEEIRVVEASDLEAVQYAGRVLAGLGASIVKIEPPAGDPVRTRPPFAETTDHFPHSVPFEFLNAGKASIVLDTGTVSGRTAVRELYADADVILWSSGGGVVDPRERPRPAGQVRLGAGAFGVDVAENVPSTAFTRLHAGTSGYLVPADKDLTFRPAAPPPYVFESAHGTAIAVSVLSELFRTGGGDIDFSLQGYGIWLDKMNFHQTSASGQLLHRNTHAYPFGGNMPCVDGYVCIFVIEEHQWRGLCDMVGQPGWITDPTLADGIMRKQEQGRLDPVILAWCAERTVDDVYEAAVAHDVPVGRVRSPQDVLDWEFLAEREFFMTEQTSFGELKLPGFPFHDGLRAAALGPAPRLGADTYRVLAGLGIDGGGRGLDTVVDDRVGVASVRTVERPTDVASRPLEGIRVLDFTWAAAGPIATSIMAYLGADVVKVESRSRPDLMRAFNKQYGVGGSIDLDSSPAFNEIAAGKRSIELDLRTAEDRETARGLAAQADVVIENMRPGKVEKLGLGYQDLAELNPRLVMCSQSATGRQAVGVPGYAPIFWAEGGGAWLTGWPDQRPGVIRAPVDLHAAAFALLGILALLRRRDRTGRGGYTDCSAIEAVTASFGSELIQVQVGLPEPVRCGNHWPGVVVNDVFPCFGDDEWVAISVETDAQWRAFCAVVGFDAEQLRHEAELGAADSSGRLWALASERTRGLDATRLEGRLLERGVPAARSMSLLAAMSDARLGNRSVLHSVQTKHGAQQTILGLPWLFDGSAYSVPFPAPLLGEHTDTVLKEWLGGDR